MRTSIVLAAVVFLTASSARCEETEPLAYGRQILLVDALSIGALATGGAGHVAPLAYLGIAGLVLGGPIVHWSHGRAARGFGSLAMRTLVPIGIGYVGAVIGSSAACTSEDCHIYNAFGGAAVGLGVGGLAAIIADWAWLGHDDAPTPARQWSMAFTGKALALRGSF